MNPAIPSVKPPTDRLHKFLAIFGLMLIVASAVLLGIAFYRVSQVDMEITREGSQIKHLEAVRDDLKRDTTQMETQGDEFSRQIKSQKAAVDAATTQSHAQTQPDKRESERFSTIDEEIRKRFESFESETYALDQDVALSHVRLKYETGIAATCIILFVVLFLIGYGVTIYGFSEWRKHEALQKRLLQAQVEKLELELAAIKKAQANQSIIVPS